MNSQADLHVHTTASDGQCTPEQIVAMARALGLRAIAVTDHETTLGVWPAQRAAAGSDLCVVAGVEISTESSQGEIHILGYFVERNGHGLEEKLEQLRQARVERAQRILRKLAALGLPLAWDRVRELAAGDSVGRPHIARAMLEKGYVSSIEEAFALYLGPQGPAYVARLRVTPTEAIAMIRKARGVPVLAHPLQVTGLVPSLAKLGLQGLETSYPGYSPEEIRYLDEIARHQGLVCTGGSDYHGPSVAGGDLGQATTPFATVAQLRARCPGNAESHR